MKKNILILLTASYGGGAERLVLDQMKYYDRDRFNLHVITLRRGNLENEFIETAKTNNVKYKSFNLKSRFSFSGLLRLNSLIKRSHIDLINTHLIEADMYGFLIKLFIPKIRLVCTKHNTNDFRKRIYWRLMNKLFSLPVNHLLAVSESVKKFISKYEFIPLKRIKVIYNGIDTNRFRKKANLTKLKRELKIKNRDFVVGIVGRLTKQKGHKYLFRVAANLKNRIPNIRILVIGDGELRKELEEYVRRLGIEKNINFLGFRDDMPGLYSLMDVFCLPSLFEGFGLVLAEAMLCDTITVGTKIQGIQEIIDDGISGFLIPPKNSEELTAILYKIYQGNFDKRMLFVAKSKVLKLFDFKKNLRKIESLYEAELKRVEVHS